MTKPFRKVFHVLLDIVRLSVYNDICRVGVERMNKMDFISVADAAIKWGLSERRVQKLCKENRIEGAIFFRRIWIIPKDAKKPIDGRYKEGKGLQNE